jgi:transmembrane sensor
MEYSDYTEVDFIQDESFVDWFKRKDAVNTAWWDAWLETHPEKKEAVESALRFLGSLDWDDGVFTDEDTQQSWESVRQVLQLPGETTKTRPIVVQADSRFRGWSKVAAAVALLLLAGSVYLFTQRNNQEVRYTTGYGNTRKIELPDGSVVTLNANSTLSFFPRWDEEHAREVRLQGEAFFSVVKKPGAGNAKFRVHTSYLNVEVLGTQFNVKERRGRTQVVLNSGKIKLNSDQHPASDTLIMKPGELVQLSGPRDTLVKKVVNPEVYSSWRNNVLIFNQTPLSEVATLIEDTYGLKVEFENDAQARKTITGNVPATNVDILLLALSKSFNFQISREKDLIRLKNNVL